MIKKFENENLNESEKMVEEDVENIENIEDIDLTEFKPSNIQSKSKSVGKSGILSIINAKTGKRITISDEVIQKLKNPLTLQLSFDNNSIAIAEKLPNNDSIFNVKKQNKKSIIYSSQLVVKITELYKLDFSKRTSLTFNEVKYTSYDSYSVAIIKIV